jgi:hypothetical protein
VIGWNQLQNQRRKQPNAVPPAAAAALDAVDAAAGG